MHVYVYVHVYGLRVEHIVYCVALLPPPPHQVNQWLNLLAEASEEESEED